MKRFLVLITHVVTIFSYSQLSTHNLKLDYLKNIDIETSTNRDPNLIDYFDLNGLIDIFIEDFEYFKNKYIECNIIPTQYTEKLDDFLFKIKKNSVRTVDFDLNEEGVLGLSKSIYDDSRITVTVNPKLWKFSSNPHRLFIMYHELGHDILNFEHGEGGKMMFTISDRDYNFREFYILRENMFRIFMDNFFKDLGYNDTVLNGSCFDLPSSLFWESKKYNYLNKLFTGTILTDSKTIPIYNGLLDGIYYNLTGFNEESCFIDGKQIDRTNFFDNGKIKRYVHFYDDFDFPPLSIDYFENGQPERFEGYPYEDKNGKRVFPIFYYYDNGNIKEIKHISTNSSSNKGYGDITHLVGKRVTYYSNGEIKSFQDFNNKMNSGVLYYDNNGNLRDGNFTTYYSNGNIESEGYYKDGRCMGSEKWYFNHNSSFLYLIHLEEGRMIYLVPNKKSPPRIFSLKNGIYDGVFYSTVDGFKSTVFTNGVFKSGNLTPFDFYFSRDYILFEFLDK